MAQLTNEQRVARDLGRAADHPDENPYDPDEGHDLYEQWQEGWDEQWRYKAISYYAGRHEGPTVAQVAEVFKITPEQVAAVCDNPYLYLAGHDDAPLADKTVEIDGE